MAWYYYSVGVLLVVWTASLSFGIVWGDSGELIAACATLGIPHPPGYPVYTRLGFWWSHLFPFGSIAWRINLLSLLSLIATFVIIGKLIDRLANPPTNLIQTTIRATTLLGIGLIPVVWDHATSAEVYGLLALGWAATWLALTYLAPSSHSRLNGSAWVIALLAGWTCAHHLLMVLTLPGILLAAWAQYQPQKRHQKITVFSGITIICAFLSGWLPYVDILWRARSTPPLNWGNPDSWSRLLWVMRGGQFPETIALMRTTQPWGAFLLESSRWFVYEHGWLAALAFCGLLIWRRQKHWICTGWSVSLLLTLGFVVNYPVADQSAFFFLPVFMLAVPALIAVETLVCWLPRRPYQSACLGFVVVVGFAATMVQLPQRWQISATIPPAHEYGRQLLNQLDTSTILIATEQPTSAGPLTPTDNFLFPIWYHQFVERRNPTVITTGQNFFLSLWYEQTLLQQGLMIPFYDQLRVGEIPIHIAEHPVPIWMESLAMDYQSAIEQSGSIPLWVVQFQNTLLWPDPRTSAEFLYRYLFRPYSHQLPVVVSYPNPWLASAGLVEFEPVVSVDVSSEPSSFAGYHLFLPPQTIYKVILPQDSTFSSHDEEPF